MAAATKDRHLKKLDNGSHDVNKKITAMLRVPSVWAQGSRMHQVERATEV